MAYSQKKSYSKKRVYKKSQKPAKKIIKNYRVKKLVSLIKKVSLKSSETKYVHQSAENINLNHNTGYQYQNLLYTTQGITDTGAGTSVFSNRLGDEVIGRGISIKLWIANKLDRPNVMYRFFVYKYQSNNPPVLANLFKSAVGNRMMDDLDKESYSIVFQKIFNVQVGYSAYATATGGDTDGREPHKYFQCWIPLKNKKIIYNDAGVIPKFTSYAWAIVPYDSYGTLTTDNIASLAYSLKFYFKDP